MSPQHGETGNAAGIIQGQAMRDAGAAVVPTSLFDTLEAEPGA